MARAYWNWVREQQRPYMAGFRPPFLVVVSLFMLSAAVTGAVGFIIGLASGGAGNGFATGVSFAIPMAIVLSALAKHQAHRHETDPWQP